MGICLQTGWIVWTNGPYPCGAWPDLNIARDWLIDELEDTEMVLADGGYNDGYQYFVTPTGRKDYIDKMMADARARHESVNKLFKDYAVLRNKYRGQLIFHRLVFGAVANIVQMRIENKETTVFSVVVEDEIDEPNGFGEL